MFEANLNIVSSGTARTNGPLHGGGSMLQQLVSSIQQAEEGMLPPSSFFPSPLSFQNPSPQDSAFHRVCFLTQLNLYRSTLRDQGVGSVTNVLSIIKLAIKISHHEKNLLNNDELIKMINNWKVDIAWALCTVWI